MVGGGSLDSKKGNQARDTSLVARSVFQDLYIGIYKYSISIILGTVFFGSL